jgi:hypothetical protein
MQSTGQNSMHTSHPVHPDWSMTASSFGRFLARGAATGGVTGVPGRGSGMRHAPSVKRTDTLYRE